MAYIPSAVPELKGTCNDWKADQFIIQQFLLAIRCYLSLLI